MKKIVIDLNCSETNYEEFLQGVEDFLKNNTNCRIVLVGIFFQKGMYLFHSLIFMM